MFFQSLKRSWEVFIASMAILGFALLTPLPALAVGPGGVSSNLQLWLKADAGVTEGATMTWDDQSPNGLQASQSTGANQPTVLTDAMNFNPALDFADGADSFLTLNSVATFPAGNSARTIIAIATRYATAAATGWIFSYGEPTAAISAGEICRLGRLTTNKVSWDGYQSIYKAPDMWGEGMPKVVIANYDSNDEGVIYVDGKESGRNTFTTPWNTILNGGSIGKGVRSDPSRYWAGTIAEVILYDKILTAVEMQQISSYLAIKYGIMLDSTIGYLASDGSTVIYPSTSTHSGYINDITGIGVDSDSGLSQLQSRSVNTDSVVEITGSGIADGNFLVWGNDDGLLTFTSLEVPSNVKRFLREWRVAETGETGSTTLSFDLTNVTGANLTDATKYSLLTDADGNFSDATITTGGTFNGNAIEFSGVNLSNGQYFSLAYANIAPIAGFSTALDFDGVDDYVTDGGSINLANQSFTVEFWVKQDISGNDDFVVAQGTNVANQGLHLGWTNLDQFRFAFFANDLDYVNSDNIWHHWAGIYDATTNLRTTYRDGIQLSQDTATADYQGSGTLNIGRRYDGIGYMDGVIDEIRVWNVARTQDEIKANMGIALYGNETGLVSYWPFSDGSGTTLSDKTANNNDGTLTNMEPATDWVDINSDIAIKSTTKQNTALNGFLPARDPDGDPLTYIIVNDDAGAAVITDANTGAFTYTPNTSGTRTFTYKVNDGIDDSNIATVTVEVIPNNAPIAGFGTALTFDGTDDYVDVPSGINIANSSFTIEAWAKRGSLGTNDTILSVGNGSGANNGVHLEFSSSNNFSFNFTNNMFDTTATFTDTDWHHWAGVFEQGVGRKIYKDGVLVEQVANLSNYTGSDILQIGNLPWDGAFKFGGQIDDVRVWDDVRTPAEIQANMDNTLTGTEPNLVGYWKFEDNTGTTAVDSASSNNGTLTGDMTWPFTTKQNTPLTDTLANFVNFDADSDSFTYIIVNRLVP